ncbi:MAG: VCBS repeat-containing protein [Myxococcota bacterium]
MNPRSLLPLLVPCLGCLPSPPSLPGQTSTESGTTNTSTATSVEPTDSGPASGTTEVGGEGSGGSTTEGTGVDSTDGGDTTGQQDFCGRPEAIFIFDDPELFPVGDDPGVLAVGPFIGNDDDPDIAVVNGDNLGSRVDILRGQGILSGFISEEPIPMTEGAHGAAVGNFDGSPTHELAVLGRHEWRIYGPDPDSSNSLLLRATGSLGRDRGFSMAAVELLGDDADELVIAGGVTDDALGWVDVIQQPISGPMGLRTLIAAGQDSARVAVGDFNGDTSLDLVLPNTDPAGMLESHFIDVVFNESTPGAPSFQRLSMPSNGAPWGVAAMDLDGDGFDDFVVGHTGGGLSDKDPLPPLQLFFGDGEGGFTETTLAHTSIQTAVEVADLDCDGDLDIITGGTGELVLWRADGPGNFDPTNTDSLVVDSHLISDIAVADFDLNGRPDIVASLIDEGDVVYFEAD